MSLAFIRLHDPGRGAVTAVVDGGEVFDASKLIESDVLGLIRLRKLNDPTFLAHVRSRLTAGAKYPRSFEQLWGQEPRDDTPHLLLPFDPPEVWGVGVSYRRAAELHEEDLQTHGRATGLYSYVYQSERPEIFFKALARHCVGHGQLFGVRGDSRGTMVEAELACVYDSDGKIVGYTIANDVTAWDLEKESPLFLSYAKTFLGSCVLGPSVTPACMIQDPLSLAVRCSIERHDKLVYEAEGNTRNMRRSLEELTHYLSYCNPIPDGTVLCTGTAVGIPNDLTIEDGDRVTIRFESLGELRNVARRYGGAAVPRAGTDSMATRRHL